MGGRAGPDIVEEGLVLCLDAGNVVSYIGSGTAWNDLSGNGNNGTLVNGPTYNSANGGSIVFNGINQYVSINSTVGFPYGSSSMTISAWGKTDNASNLSWLISYGTPSASQSRYVGVYNSLYYFGSFGNDITATGALSNTWFNISGTYDGANARLYVNGVLVSGPTSKTWNLVASTAQLARQTNGGEYLDGNVAQATIYSRALSAAEIVQNYSAIRGRFGF